MAFHLCSSVFTVPGERFPLTASPPSSRSLPLGLRHPCGERLSLAGARVRAGDHDLLGPSCSCAVRGRVLLLRGGGAGARSRLPVCVCSVLQAVASLGGFPACQRHGWRGGAHSVCQTRPWFVKLRSCAERGLPPPPAAWVPHQGSGGEPSTVVRVADVYLATRWSCGWAMLSVWDAWSWQTTTSTSPQPGMGTAASVSVLHVRLRT